MKRRARPFDRTATRWSRTRRIALVVACCVASFALGAVSVDWLTTPAPAPAPPTPPAEAFTAAEELTDEPVIRETFIIELRQPRRAEPTLVDYMSPEEMWRDLHDRHGAECDRPDLDRRMIDEITPPRR